MKFICKEFNKILPKITGFNHPYIIKFTTNSKIKAHSYFDCINEKGVTEGKAGFTVTVDFVTKYINVAFDNDNRTRYLEIKYDLRKYINNIMVETLSPHI